MVNASNIGFDPSGWLEIRPIEPDLARFLVVKAAFDSSVAIKDENLALMCELKLEGIVLEGELPTC